MSEQQYDQQQQPSPPAGGPQPEPTIQEATEGSPPPAQQPVSADATYDVRLVKRETGSRHFVTASGTWETITHGETGEPEHEYVLLASIDGVDVPLASYNSGRLETVLASERARQQEV